MKRNESNMSWYLNLSINDVKTLFSNEILPYEVDVYICSCGNKEFIIKQKEDRLELFKCPICDNTNFQDANKYQNNFLWYENISNLFPLGVLTSIEPSFTVNEKSNEFDAKFYIDIPNSVDLANSKIKHTKKLIFSFSINAENIIYEKTFVNFDLESYLHEDENEYDSDVKDDELINRSPILITYKRKILKHIKLIKKYLSIRTIQKSSTVEESVFFIRNSNLLDNEFYKWQNISYLPKNKTYSIDDGLDFVVNKRTESSLIKAVFKDYKKQIREDDTYSFLYPYVVATHIDDVNIAQRMLDLNFKKHLEYIQLTDIYFFMEFLIGRFTYKQIENIFLGFSKEPDELFWLIHSVNLVNALRNNIHHFPKVKANYKILHNELSKFYGMVSNKVLSNTIYSYDQKFIDACINSEFYTIKLPQTGSEIYDWSCKLTNCLSSYNREIKKKETVIYGFFNKDVIEFAVEIRNNKIIEARGKYNRNLTDKEMNFVNEWFKSHFQLKQSY